MKLNQLSERHPGQLQAGFTMVELLVAMVLGFLLTAAVIQSYLSAKQTYRVTEGVSRIQENARFSLYFITKALRNAGYSGCIGRVRNKLNGDADDYISFKGSVIGWDYNGTDSENTSFELTGDPVILPTTTTNWTTTTGVATISDLPGYLAGRVVEGSDVMWFKTFDELDIIIKQHEDMGAPIVTEDAHEVANDSIMLVGNCAEVEIFQHLSQGSGNQVSLVADEGRNGDPGNRKTSGDPNWARTYTAEDNLYGFVQTYYYIGEGASGLPSLFRYYTGRPEDAILGSQVLSGEEELVEGVETMQLLFGEDTDDDNNPNNYVSANQVVDWDNVLSVRVGLLLRSPINATDDDQLTDYTLLDNIDFTHAADDYVLRYAVNTTIKLRNRGLDENLAYYLCDATDESKGDDNGTPTCH